MKSIIILIFLVSSVLSQSIEPCQQNNPCLNGGFCFSLNSTVSCLCQKGWTGASCETAIDFCNPSPCQNNATCIRVGYLDYKCDCTSCNSDYTGRNCEIMNNCKSQPCLNGGYCENTNSSYTCKCPRGFTGLNCETKIDLCASNTCLNGGQCQKWGFFDYKCVCTSNYTGRNCENNNYCNINGQPCQNGGRCENTQSTYKCKCPMWYSGINCETSNNFCTILQPCANGATCVSCVNNNNSCQQLGQLYKCNCPFGFSGKNCFGYLTMNACLSACRSRRCIYMSDAYYCNGFLK